MADEEVSFLLKLRDEFSANMEKAGLSVEKFDQEMKRAAAETEQAQKRIADIIKKTRDGNELARASGVEKLRILEARELAIVEESEEAKALIREKWAIARERLAEEEAEKLRKVEVEATKARLAEMEQAQKAYWTEINQALEVGIKGFKAVVAIGSAVVGTFREMGQEAVAYAEDVRRISDSTGLAVEKVQELRFAFREGGPQAAEQGLQTFARNLGQALADASSESAKVFAKMGIEIRDASGFARDAGAVFDETADRIASMGTEAEQTAATSKLLGEEAGKRLAAQMAEGSSGLREQAERARELGLVVSRETVTALRGLGDDFRILGEQGAALSREFFEPFIDDFRDLAKFASKVAEELRPLVQIVGPMLSDALREAVHWLGAFNELLMSPAGLAIGAALGPLGPAVLIYRDAANKLREVVQEAKARAAKDGADAFEEFTPAEEVGEGPKFTPFEPISEVSVNAADERRERIAEILKRTIEENEVARVTAFEKLRILEERELEVVSASEEAKAAVSEKYRLLREEQAIVEAERRMKETEEKFKDDEAEFERAARRADADAAFNQRLVENAMTRAEQLKAVQDRELAQFTGSQEQRQKIEKRYSNERDKLDHQDKLKRINKQIETVNAIEGIALAAGVRSHGVQKALAISKAILDFNAAKVKAAGQTGVAAPASIAMIAGLLIPIIGAMKSSTPFEGGGGGGGGGGSFTMPDISAPAAPEDSPPSVQSAPSAVSAPPEQRNQIVVNLDFLGGMLLMDEIAEKTQEAIVANSRDGRTDVVVRRRDRLS